MKPIELVERALRNSGKTRDTILDPFGGSGTTLIACDASVLFQKRFGVLCDAIHVDCSRSL
jgi:hypothetical protein